MPGMEGAFPERKLTLNVFPSTSEAIPAFALEGSLEF